MQVERHSPALSLRLFESEHQDGQGFHREAPSHAKSVRFPEQVNISPANDDRGQLEGDNEIELTGVAAPERAYIATDAPDPAVRVAWKTLLPHRQTWTVATAKCEAKIFKAR